MAGSPASPEKDASGSANSHALPASPASLLGLGPPATGTANASHRCQSPAASFPQNYHMPVKCSQSSSVLSPSVRQQTLCWPPETAE